MANKQNVTVDQPIRLPLVGQFNTRPVPGTATSTNGVVGVGIVGTMVVGSFNQQTKDQRFINAIPDKITNPLTNVETYYVYKRPGLESYITPASGKQGCAIKVWTGKGTGTDIISAFISGVTSTIYNGTTSLGTVSGSVYEITETLVGTVPTIAFTTDGNAAYYYQDGGSLTQITDVDFPGNAAKTITGSFVHMNGYSYILTTDGNIYNSDLNNISTWGSTSFIATNMYPDQGVGLARYKDLIVAFGKETTEFFRDVGNELGSPLEKVSEAFIKIGALGPSAICQLEDNVAWIASTDIGSTSVYILDGYKPNRVSNNTIDSLLSMRTGGAVTLSSVKLYGKTFLFVTFADISYVYCVEDQIWHEWKPATGQSVLWHKWAGNTNNTGVVYSISKDSTSGKIFRIVPGSLVYQDDGTTLTMTIQTSKFDMGTEKFKRLHRLTIVGDTTPSSATLAVSWSDDDYLTFNTPRNISLTGNNKYLLNCGQFRRRAFKLEDTSNTPVRLEALEFYIVENIH